MRSDLFEEPPLLDYIAHRLHLDGLHFVDVFECVRRPGLFVLDHSDLALWSGRMNGRGRGKTDLPECAFSNDLEQSEVEERDLAVVVDGLRTTTNGPHGVVEGEEDEDGFTTAAGSDTDHPLRKRGSPIQLSSGRHHFRPSPCPNFLQSIRRSVVFPETTPAT